MDKLFDQCLELQLQEVETGSPEKVRPGTGREAGLGHEGLVAGIRGTAKDSPGLRSASSGLQLAALPKLNDFSETGQPDCYTDLVKNIH